MTTKDLSYRNEAVGIVINNNMAGTAEAPYVMQPEDNLFHIESEVTTFIELPSVTTAAGRFYSLVFDTDTSIGAVATITCTGSDSIVTTGGLITSFILDAEYEFAVLYCDGVYWYQLASYPVTMEEPVV